MKNKYPVNKKRSKKIKRKKNKIKTKKNKYIKKAKTVKKRKIMRGGAFSAEPSGPPPPEQQSGPLPVKQFVLPGELSFESSGPPPGYKNYEEGFGVDEFWDGPPGSSRQKIPVWFDYYEGNYYSDINQAKGDAEERQDFSLKKDDKNNYYFENKTTGERKDALLPPGFEAETGYRGLTKFSNGSDSFDDLPVVPGIPMGWDFYYVEGMNGVHYYKIEGNKVPFDQTEHPKGVRPLKPASTIPIEKAQVLTTGQGKAQTALELLLEAGKKNRQDEQQKPEFDKPIQDAMKAKIVRCEECNKRMKGLVTNIFSTLKDIKDNKGSGREKSQSRPTPQPTISGGLRSPTVPSGPSPPNPLTPANLPPNQ